MINISHLLCLKWGRLIPLQLRNHLTRPVSIRASRSGPPSSLPIQIFFYNLIHHGLSKVVFSLDNQIGFFGSGGRDLLDDARR